MRLPKWLYLFWRRRIYLRSVGWQRTRQRILKRGRRCSNVTNRGEWCPVRHSLHIHHRDYSKHPQPALWHFLPFARHFITEQDYSDMVPLCGVHHALTHAKVVKNETR